MGAEIMRITFNQTNGFLQTGNAGQRSRQNIAGQSQKNGTSIRSDRAVFSPQGKMAGRLANLMSQKELIQMNKDSLLKQTLDEENGTGSAGLKEQLEEYEEQLDTLNEQIAAEMAKQAEETEEQDKICQKPQNTGSPESADDSLARLTELSTDLEKAQIHGQASIRREGDKRVCESEIKLGSTAAKRKLEKIQETERYTGQMGKILGKI